MLFHTVRTHPHAGLITLALGLLLGAILLEIAAFAFAGKRYAWSEARASLAVALLQRLATGASAVVLSPLFAFVWDHRRATFAPPLALQVPLAFLLVECAYYWMHRLSHTIAWMWATHSVHHSAEQLNLPAAIRLGATGLISLEWLPFLPLVFFGISPTVVAGLLAFNLLYQFFLHSELIPKLGPLEWVLNTPSHHRVHHARNERYLDRNFGGVLVVYDRIFGTYAVEREDEPPVYGLRGERRGLNPFVILFAGWPRALGLVRAAAGDVSAGTSGWRARPPVRCIPHRSGAIRIRIPRKDRS